MGIIKKGANIAKNQGGDVDKLPAEARDFLLDGANRNLQEELSDWETFATELDGFSDADAKDGVTVTTPKELKKAIEEKQDIIVITGKLAKKMEKAEKIKKLSPAVLAMIGGLSAAATAALAAAPAAAVAAPGVGGAAALTAFAATAAPAAAASGLSIPVLFVISAVGLAAMSILFDEYSRVEVEAGKLIFERKRKKKENL